MGSFPSPFCYKDMVMGCCGKNGRATRRFRHMIKEQKKVIEKGGSKQNTPYMLALLEKRKKLAEKEAPVVPEEPEAPDLPKVG